MIDEHFSLLNAAFPMFTPRVQLIFLTFLFHSIQPRKLACNAQKETALDDLVNSPPLNDLSIDIRREGKGKVNSPYI